MSEQTPTTLTQTPWHRFLAKAMELAATTEQIGVDSEIATSSEPPRVDIVLLRRETAVWTTAQRAILPDSVRDASARFILWEFKYSESLTLDTIRQAQAYLYFFRTTRGLKPEEVQMFILCAKTPQARRLATFEYEATDISGVYRSRNIYAAEIPLLVLNELSDEPHNALVKVFASRKAEKAKAFRALREHWALPSGLLTLLDVLQSIWSLPEGATMKEVLTVERVMEMAEERKRILLRNLPPEELDALLDPAYKQSLLQAGQAEGREEGREEGELAMRNTIEQILRQRLGEVPLAVKNQLRQCTLAELNDLVNPALDVTTWDAFVAYLPKRAA